MLEFFHDEEVRAALYQCHDGPMISSSNNRVHLPVSELAAVNLLGTFVYACLVPDASGLGLMPVPGVVAILHLVSAVCGKRTACVVADHLVKWSREISLHLLCQVAGYLFGRPLLPSDEFFYAPGERLARGAVSRSTMHTDLRKGIGLVPDCFMDLFLLFFQADCIPLLTG